jgi:hypothetical protein
MVNVIAMTDLDGVGAENWTGSEKTAAQAPDERLRRRVTGRLLD